MSGAVSDRVNLRPLMITCEAVQAVLFAAIALLPPLPAVLVLYAVARTLSQVFAPASRIAVAALVPDRDLPTANSAIGFGENGLEVLGPVLAAGLVGVIGISGLLAVDAASFLLSALLLLGLPSLPAARLPASQTASLLRHAREGLGYLWATRAVRLVAASFFAVVAFNALDDAALVFLATGPLGADQSATSLLYAGSGAGLLAGYALLSRYGVRVAAPTALIVGYAVSSLGNLLTGLAWTVPAALVVQAVRELGLAAQDVAAATLIQLTVPRRLQGRVFGNLYGAIGLAAGLSYVAGAVLILQVGPRLALLVAGGGGLVVAAATATRSAALREKPP